MPGYPNPAVTLEPLFAAAADGTRVRCELCAHRCLIAPGKAGRCSIRVNTDGVLTLPFAGRVSAMNVDPIEKKPLYHFRPGSSILSIGFLGCNFRCPFCQNYAISQSTAGATRPVTPGQAAKAAVETARSGNIGIAYTYNEPSIHIEYILETAVRIRAEGLANVIVTNGHLLEEPARALLTLMDAANVDLKSADERFYRDELGGSLVTVRRFLALAAELTHLEVTTLLVPGRNDSDEEVDQIARFVASLGRSIPLHLSAYHPAYRYDAPPTTRTAVERATAIARRHLDYVYPGNTGDAAETRCPGCGALLVSRHGYKVRVVGLDGSACSACGHATRIVR